MVGQMREISKLRSQIMIQCALQWVMFDRIILSSLEYLQCDLMTHRLFFLASVISEFADVPERFPAMLSVSLSFSAAESTFL